MSLKWGILGASRIASKAIPLIQDQIQISAIASRSAERVREFAVRFGIQHIFTNYEELIKSPQVDAIYITLANDQHFAWSKMALENGKHVLCEKPLVLNLSQAQILKEISQTTGALLMEGFMYRHHNQIQYLKNLIDSCHIGELQSIYSSFHFTIPEGPNIRLSPEQGGGALMDVGCYCIDLSNYLFGKTPKRVFGSAFTRSVDWAFNGTIEYDPGQTATFDCSFQGYRNQFLQVIGTKGFAKLENPFKGEALEYIEMTTEARIEKVVIKDETNSFLKEFLNFEWAIQGQMKPLVTIDETIINLKVIEELKSSAAIETRVTLW